MKNELFKYIIRNIGRKKKQAFFTVLCVAISSFVILIYLSLNNGIQKQLREAINNSFSAQIIVYNTPSAGINILETQINEQEVFLWSDDNHANLVKQFHNLAIHKRVRFGSLLSFKENLSYALIHALETSHFEKLEDNLFLIDGTIPKQNEILISESMASDIDCHVGDTLLLMADNINGYISDEICVVSGIFRETGLAIYFDHICFIPYSIGQTIIQLEKDECVELLINAYNKIDIPENEYNRIAKFFQTSNSDLKIASWNKTVPLLYTVVNVWKGASFFIQVIFISFSLIILINIVALIVNHRKKEFGTLLAMGFSWNKIISSVCIEFLIISTMAVLIAYSILSLIFSFLPYDGINIASKEMQAALMSEKLSPFLYLNNLFYVLLLFSTTIVVSILISLMKLKKQNIISLINKK
ncbi:MAG: FtsX-like permease family protein [Dysgonamonadaceae bacterium]|jgi:ABC-type lipoprotein release transport system permease subunit|nr:FtsX-like permease family protein [Dysgonamonadaceae bacterium]